MLKRIATCALTAGALTIALSGVAHAESNGVGNGSVGCKLANNSTYGNPAEMLKYLAGRDGSFQNTVDKYPGSFSSVGDLIGQKCGG